MATIAIVDDNLDNSNTVRKNLQIALSHIGSDLGVITTLPFKDPEDYFNYLQVNEVVVLILDEKLDDQAVDSSGPVSYKGSDLISILRAKLKELPVFVITVIPSERELDDKSQEFEQIIKRQDFYDFTDKYASRIWRSANNYLHEREQELSQFALLSARFASGLADDNDLVSLRALQSKLEIPFSGFAERNKWLDEYQKQLARLNEIIVAIKSQM